MDGDKRGAPLVSVVRARRFLMYGSFLELVRCSEVVRFSEGPLREVPLQSMAQPFQILNVLFRPFLSGLNYFVFPGFFRTLPPWLTCFWLALLPLCPLFSTKRLEEQATNISLRRSLGVTYASQTWGPSTQGL
jgi:hypothetical protein